MEAAMDSGSVRATMSIFGESISGRKAEKNRGHALAQENLSSEMKQIAKSSMDKLNERKASVDNERAGAESELSRARAMAKELERQIDQTKAKVTSQRSELQTMRASRTRKNEAEEAPDAHDGEVAQELDRVKRELRKLMLEVKSAAEAKAKAESDVVTTVCKIQSNLQATDEMKRRVDEANEEHVLVELARIEAERERREIEAQRVAEAERYAREIEASRAKVKAARREVSRVRELEAKLEATKADVEVLQGEMELVRAMEKNHVTDVDDGAAEATARQKKEEAQDRALLQATEAELGAAKEELESIKAGGFQFMTSMDLTRTELMRVVEEIDRLRAQEKNADAQVQQLNSKLLKARAQLEAVTAADERSKAIVSNLTAAMQQLHAETEAASKEEELTMLEKRCVIAEAENVTREMATAEERIRQAVKELEAAKASEASAMKKLKAAAESTMQARASAAWWLLRGRENRSGQRTWGRKRRHVGVGGWFCSIRSPREIPGKPRMARGVRTKLGRFPDENEDLGARLGRFSPYGCKKRLVRGFSGRRVEMLLVSLLTIGNLRSPSSTTSALLVIILMLHGN